MNKWTNRHWVKHGTIYLNIKDICTAIACVWRRSKAEKLRPYIYTTEKTLLGQTVTCTYSYLLNYVSIRHRVCQQGILIKKMNFKLWNSIHIKQLFIDIYQT